MKPTTPRDLVWAAANSAGPALEMADHLCRMIAEANAKHGDAWPDEYCNSVAYRAQTLAQELAGR